MQVQDVYSNGIAQSTGLSQLDLFKEKNKEETQTLPHAWGSDKVSISDEARAALQAANSEKEQGTEEKSTGAGAEFSAYMKNSRSKAQSQDPEERLKDLQDKLKSLESQLTKLVKDDSKPGNEALIENITSQINTVMQEIAELSSQMAEDKEKA